MPEQTLVTSGENAFEFTKLVSYALIYQEAVPQTGGTLAAIQRALALKREDGLGLEQAPQSGVASTEKEIMSKLISELSRKT
jgi:hypothetical protein